MEYVIVNGEIIKKEEANFTSFFWNNPLIFTKEIWFGFGGIPLFAENLEQLKDQLQSLGTNTPALFLNQREFFRRIKRMLNKNRFYRTGLIYIQLLISNSKTDFVLLATPFEETEFKYREKGVLTEFAKTHKYSKTPLLISDYTKRIFDRLDGAKDEDSSAKNFIFLNERGMVCDAGPANVFFIQKNVLMTPSLPTGCVPDHLRKLVLEAAGALKLQLRESDEILPESIFKMEEIFFAGEATGIHWILGIETKRFVHHISGEIHNELNKILKSKVVN